MTSTSAAMLNHSPALMVILAKANSKTGVSDLFRRGGGAPSRHFEPALLNDWMMIAITFACRSLWAITHLRRMFPFIADQRAFLHLRGNCSGSPPPAQRVPFQVTKSGIYPTHRSPKDR
jgi:hypothetical protein